MLALRLVNIIEEHAEQLAEAVVHELRTDSRTPSYHALELREDQARVFEVIHNLGMWLDHSSDTAAENAYRALGHRRFLEGVPLSEVVWALVLIKQVIRRFIQAEGWLDSALDLQQRVDLYVLVGRFFDRAIYFTVLSYETEARTAAKTGAEAAPQKRKRGDWAFGKSPSAPSGH